MNKNLCRSTMVVLLIAALGSVSMGQTTSSRRDIFPLKPISRLFFSGNLIRFKVTCRVIWFVISHEWGRRTFNGYRLWSKANKDMSFKVVGDDAYVTTLPFGISPTRSTWLDSLDTSLAAFSS